MHKLLGQVFFQQDVRRIALLGAAQALDAHVVLAVEVADVRVFLADMTGKLPVDDGVSAVDLRQRLFKIDVKHVFSNLIADAEGVNLAADLQHKSLQAERLISVKGLSDGDAFTGKIVLLRTVFQMRGIPLRRELAAAWKLRSIQRENAEIGVSLLKMIAVVALALQLFAVQVGQMVDLVDIVEAVSHRAEVEPAGEQRLEACNVRLQQAENAAREAALGGIGQKRLDRTLQVAVSGRKGIGFAGKLAQNDRLALKKRDLLVSPEIQRDEGRLGAVTVSTVEKVV